MTRLEVEIDRNFEAFSARLPGLLPNRHGEFAVLRAAEIVAFHPNLIGALQAARQRFPDGLFSIQRVEEQPSDLGIQSRAVHLVHPR